MLYYYLSILGGFSSNSLPDGKEMKKKYIAGLLLLAFTVVSYGAVVSAASQDRLTMLKAVWERELTRIHNESATQAISWPSEYANLLNQLRARMQGSGNLDGWVVVDKELKRFTSKKTISEIDIVKTPSALKEVQEKYLAISSGLQQEANEDIINLKELYFHHLLNLQTELTKQGKIPEALKVKTEIQRVGTMKEVSDAQVAMIDEDMDEEEELSIEAGNDQSAGAADPGPVNDEQIKQWLELYEKYVAARDQHFSGGKKNKRSYKHAYKAWRQVSGICFRTLSEIKATDSLSTKQMKQDYKQAQDQYLAAKKAIRKDDQDEEARTRFSAAETKLKQAEYQLLGIYSKK